MRKCLEKNSNSTHGPPDISPGIPTLPVQDLELAFPYMHSAETQNQLCGLSFLRLSSNTGFTCSTYSNHSQHISTDKRSFRYAAIMAHNLGLGTLTSLPRELRDQVWHFSLIERRFAFIQASHHILAEASPIRDRVIYNDTVLKFGVCPTYRHNSWLNVETQFKSEWVLQSMDHAMRSGLHKLHYEKLRRIEINIEAPDWKDPGQITNLYKKRVDVASLLGNSRGGLPDIEINLLDSPLATWSPDGSPSSIYYHLREHYAYGPARDAEYGSDGDFHFDDTEIVIHAFCRLRNAKSANLHRSWIKSHDHTEDNELIALTLSEPFNVDLDPDDRDDQRQLDEIFIGLDLALDLLPGDTANMLRLDRFSSWYVDKSRSEPHYENELERIIKSLSSHRVKERKIFSLYERYSGMIVFNPNLDNEDQETWHLGVGFRWGDGIPPFNSDEYCRTFDGGVQQSQCAKIFEKL